MEQGELGRIHAHEQSCKTSGGSLLFNICAGMTEFPWERASLGLTYSMCKDEHKIDGRPQHESWKFNVRKTGTSLGSGNAP